MTLRRLIKFYKYSFDAVEVYSIQDDTFLCRCNISVITDILDIQVSKFNIYENEETTILEIWV